MSPLHQRTSAGKISAKSWHTPDRAPKGWSIGSKRLVTQKGGKRLISWHTPDRASKGWSAGSQRSVTQKGGTKDGAKSGKKGGTPLVRWHNIDPLRKGWPLSAVIPQPHDLSAAIPQDYFFEKSLYSNKSFNCPPPHSLTMSKRAFLR